VIAAALPYFVVYRIGPLPSYAWLLLAAVALGSLAMLHASRRYQLPIADMAGLAGVLVVASFVGAHVFDVAANQLDEAREHGAVWWQLWTGISLFGALGAIALVTIVWTRARKLPLAKVADCVALGWLVALVIGRIGCALVHDHVGGPTALPFGIDFPRGAAWRYPDATGPLRLHDLGVDELFVAIVLCGVMWTIARRLKPGLTAVVTALAYAPIRFALDFLRDPESDLHHAGLTAAQWGCIAMTALAIHGAVRCRQVH
jgi:phosphatidylglycerol:prolipoprotein diacylglycerol transferase